MPRELIDAEPRIRENERSVERLLAQKYRIDRFTVYPVCRLVPRLRVALHVLTSHR